MQYLHGLVAAASAIPCTQVEQDQSGDYPVAVVRGMSHMQFASGTPPPVVKAQDLQPEITYDDAHNQVGLPVLP